MNKLQQVVLWDETADTEMICWLPVAEYGLRAGSRVTLKGIDDVVWTVRTIYGVSVAPSVIHRSWKVGGLA